LKYTASQIDRHLYVVGNRIGGGKMTHFPVLVFKRACCLQALTHAVNGALPERLNGRQNDFRGMFLCSIGNCSMETGSRRLVALSLPIPDLLGRIVTDVLKVLRNVQRQVESTHGSQVRRHLRSGSRANIFRESNRRFSTKFTPPPTRSWKVLPAIFFPKSTSQNFDDRVE
jgi:hypothetical protein